jgi:hypothetical protein
MKSNIFCFLLFIVCSSALANTPNTLISIHAVELNNKDKPVQRTYIERATYRLINENTHKITLITQKSKAKAIYLEPGQYCFKSLERLNSNINIRNPACFNVLDNAISNAGTWLIGYRSFSDNEQPSFHQYALLLDHKDNYSELESILEVKNSVPVIANNLPPK